MEVLSYHCDDVSIPLAVQADHQPREGVCTTLHADGTTGKTTHVFYWWEAGAEGEVRSCLADAWTGTAPA